MIPLLLTATVDPKGMQGAAFEPRERARQYVEAVRFYRSVLPGWPIVVAENSSAVWLLSDALEDVKQDPMLELLDVSEGVPYDSSKGKGYNEVLTLTEATRKSRLLQEAGCFFKVTGRLKVLNIASLLKECVGQTFRADCKDHPVYEWLHMPINGHAGECRYWYATVDFYLEMMAPRYHELNDYTDPPVLAEDLMLDVCRKSRGRQGCKDRFRTQARISGRGGHDLGKGSSFFYSTDNDSLALRTKCAIRQVIRWVLPFWKA